MYFLRSTGQVIPTLRNTIPTKLNIQLFYNSGTHHTSTRLTEGKQLIVVCDTAYGRSYACTTTVMAIHYLNTCMDAYKFGDETTKLIINV